MNLDNVMTYKTQGINIPYDEEKSLINIPSHEDWTMVVEVTAIEGDIIKGKKIWDSKANIFEAKNICNGYVEIGQNVIFYRVAEGFFCILPLSWIFVQDLGNATGQEVSFLADGSTELNLNSPILPLKASDSLARFHNGNPPFAEGRIYFAQKLSNIYLVWLLGFGTETYTPEVVLETAKIKLHCDNQGNVINVSYEDTGQQDDFWVRNLELWWTYLYNANYHGDMGRIYLNIAGEDLPEYKNKMQKKEILVYSPNFSTYLCTMIKSQIAVTGTPKYIYPLKWSHDAYMDWGLQADDYYTRLIARSTDPNTLGVNVYEYPAGGVFPPEGCLDDTDLIQYRVKEYYTDGTSRITQKDLQIYNFYEDIAPSDNTNMVFKCFGYVPFPRTTGWYIAYDNAYFYVGVTRTGFAGTMIPAQYGVLSDAIYYLYIYKDDGTGIGFRNYVITASLECEYYDGEDLGFIGCIKAPRRGWGIASADAEVVLPVIFYGDTEIWCLPRAFQTSGIIID